ncbi:MAG: hypothetical protein M9963_07620 [Kiritimatiellae bacterium]|nr:hypothetical protein [Kiritimatiellia bacterium]
MWGLWSASMLVSYYAIRAFLRKRGIRTRKSIKVGGVVGSHALMFVLNLVGIIFFRSADMAAIGSMLRALLGFNGASGFPPYLWFFVFIIMGWYIVEFAQEYLNLNARWARLPGWLRALGWAALLVIVALGSVNLQTPYLYFQF